LIPKAKNAPINCAVIKKRALPGSIPVNVSVNILPIVTAGLAKEVEEVNQ
jgi:hypothetical protein